MIELVVSAGGCLVIGLMATLHPCPLATNAAAVSMLVNHSGKRRKFSIGVLFFGIGYMISLITVAVLINVSIFSISKISLALQYIISLFLGPVLILVGMLVSGLLKFNRRNGYLIKPVLLRNGSYFYVFTLGMLLALAFCPATASLFFGILIPLSLKYDQVFLFPLLYSIGGFLPIIGIAYLVKRGGDEFLQGKWATSITKFSGYLLIVIGVYISVQQLYLQ